jgi:hypothetical protein
MPLMVLKMQWCLKKVQVLTVTMVFVDNDSSSEDFTGFCDQLKLYMNCTAILLSMFVSLSLKCEKKKYFSLSLFAKILVCLMIQEIWCNYLPFV